MRPPVYTRKLTPRQIEILATFGRTGRIWIAAADLGVKPQTLKNELSLIYRTLGVRGIAGAIWTVFVADTE